jgi:hypothetical protein
LEPPLRLHALRYDERGRLTYPASRHREAHDDDLAGYLEEARRVLAAAGDGRHAPPGGDGATALPGLSADFEALRWFVLPPECLAGTEAAGADGPPSGIGSP